MLYKFQIKKRCLGTETSTFFSSVKHASLIMFKFFAGLLEADCLSAACNFIFNPFLPPVFSCVIFFLCRMNANGYARV